jgi:hypothetical protein
MPRKALPRLSNANKRKELKKGAVPAGAATHGQVLQTKATPQAEQEQEQFEREELAANLRKAAEKGDVSLLAQLCDTHTTAGTSSSLSFTLATALG